jgi:hypothetical protein
LYSKSHFARDFGKQHSIKAKTTPAYYVKTLLRASRTSAAVEFVRGVGHLRALCEVAGDVQSDISCAIAFVAGV